MTRTEPPGAGLVFLKMHGAGNDFVIVDARRGADWVTADLARALGDRHRGVGFDQLAVIGPGAAEADATLTFWNADGSHAGACGNATRCIADLLMREGVAAPLMRAGNGLLTACRRADGLVAVDMGPAHTGWREIPLAEPADTAALPIEGAPAATGMGNPHCTFFVEDLDAVDLAARGAAAERHPLFPERTNVQFVEVLAPDRVRAKVWERGVGPTLASGSSACAIAVAGARKGLTGRSLSVMLPGGTLEADWRADGHVEMAGPVVQVFEGRLTPGFLEGLAP